MPVCVRLLKSICMPVLLYAVEVLPFSKALVVSVLLTSVTPGQLDISCVYRLHDMQIQEFPETIFYMFFMVLHDSE